MHLHENNIPTEAILFNVPTRGNWTSTSGISPNGYINKYTFSLAEKTNINIDLTSEYAKYIKINGRIGISANSNTDISFAQELEKGTYTIDIVIDGIYDLNETAEYILTIEANVEPALAIRNLHAEVKNAYTSTISWRIGNSNTVGYKIYLNNKLVADISVNNNTYNLAGLHPNSEYFYSIIAYNNAGNSKTVNGSFITKPDDYTWLVPILHTIL